MMPKSKFHFERYELKYLLDPVSARQIQDRLIHSYCEWDPFVKDKTEKGYWLTNVYFDSPGLICFHEKMAGLSERFKIRLRAYGADLERAHQVFWEIKRKSGMVIIKDRILVPAQSLRGDHGAHDLIELYETIPFVGGQESTFQEILYKLKAHSMRPILVNKYFRQPMMSKHNSSLRITFDTSIQVSPFSNVRRIEDAYDLQSRKVIMEVKYNNSIPAWLHRIIVTNDLRRVSFSKYTEGVQALGHHFYL